MRRSTVSALVGIARGRSRRAAASPPTAALIRPWAAVRLRAPGVGAHQLGQALGEGVPGAGRVAAVEAAHVEAEVDPAAEGGQIGRTPPVAAVHGPAGAPAAGAASARAGARRQGAATLFGNAGYTALNGERPDWGHKPATALRLDSTIGHAKALLGGCAGGPSGSHIGGPPRYAPLRR